PDKVYQRPHGTMSCFYAQLDDISGDLVCGCIIGTALYGLGVPLRALAALGNGTIGECVNHGRFPLIDASDPLVRALKGAQSKQDLQYTWGEAVAYGTYLATVNKDGISA